jgi:tryptophan-rich sensory protein
MSFLRTKLGLGVFAAASIAAAAIGGMVGRKRSNKLWYRFLRKPAITPPDATFGIVWPGLYALGSWSARRVAKTPDSRERTTALALWGAQLACNALWTPAFFGAHRPRLAFGILLANAAALGGYAYFAGRVDPIAAVAVAPNLAWLGFAGVLNASVIRKNARGPFAFLTRG